MKVSVIFAASIAAAMFSAGVSTAAEFRPFTARDFAAAQAAGKPIVVDVFAPWCPTCKAQEPIVRRLSAEPKFDRVIVFRLDFDSQKAAWRVLKVWRQSTLIAFKGQHETGRSVADTDPVVLERLFDTAIQ